MSSDMLSVGGLVNSRYEIISVLGAGGMGSVYKVKDRMLPDEIVALKVLHPDFARDEKQRQRFLREVQLMRKVNHANVVRTYDVGVDGDLVYFSMEFVAGRPLDALIEEGTLDFSYLPELIMQVSEGLSAIHAAEIVHRDLKPGNIMILDGGVAKIADFGVARPASSELTAHNEIVGSVHYMAPEVWLGKEITPHADLYGLGIILYEITTGQLPFKHTRPATLMWMHVKSVPTPPIQLNPKIPEWLNKLILKLIAKSPLERPRDARELASMVSFYARGNTGVFSTSRTTPPKNPGELYSPHIVTHSGETIRRERRPTGIRTRTQIRKARADVTFEPDILSSVIVGGWVMFLLFICLYFLLPRIEAMLS